jgi:hypothetical protein
MIRTVGNNGGTPIDPAANHAARDSRADSIAKAQSLGALRISAGGGDGSPPVEDGHGAAISRFSEQLGLGPDILLGIGADEKAAAIGEMRSDIGQASKSGRKP